MKKASYAIIVALEIIIVAAILLCILGVCLANCSGGDEPGGFDSYYLHLEKIYKSKKKGDAFEFHSYEDDEAMNLLEKAFEIDIEEFDGNIKRALYFLDESGDNFDVVFAFELESKDEAKKLKELISGIKKYFASEDIELTYKIDEHFPVLLISSSEDMIKVAEGSIRLKDVKH